MYFTYDKWKNAVVQKEDKEFDKKLKELVEYLLKERKKGKIPLIVAGAGASAKDVSVKPKARSDNRENGAPVNDIIYSQQGLPCLSEMILKLIELIKTYGEQSESSEVQELLRLCKDVNHNLDNVNREWLSKVFSLLEKSTDKETRNIWENYCTWFFFECIEYDNNGKTEKCGALNTYTSKASKEIAKMYDNFGAICLSANFDNYIDFALSDVQGNRKGIPIFDSTLAEKYFKRNRRGEIDFKEPPYNRCVLHANGDVFWLYCSGEKGEGYCPETGKRTPAFTRSHLNDESDMYCDFCNSKLEVTMTMPGTYEKDYNTRAIISAIWTYLASKVSGVITVGLSCNWDEVLLKFIYQLIKENDIPLLDINNLSDLARDHTSNIIERIVKESHLETCAYIVDAAEGIEKLNKWATQYNADIPALENANAYKKQLKQTLENMPEIKRLSRISQLGLKSYWMESTQKNERWHHSIQVADIAVDMYERLCKNSKKEPLIFEKVLLYASGLLHDCGHLPFSHLLEDVFEELSWHFSGENRSFRHGHNTKRIIEKMCRNPECCLKSVLKTYGVDEQEIIKCIEGRYGIGYIDALINGAIDADKIAYIFTDAKDAKKNITLDQKEFLEELLDRAYITQEGMISFDDKSAWYAMRLLDERKRMYDELYYDTRVRCLEAAVKYIVTTYFVQKYNNSSLWKNETDKNVEDLGNSHIETAIQDLFDMIEKEDTYVDTDLSASVGDEVKSGIKQCMRLILNSHKSKEENPGEIVILSHMYKQLIGNDMKEILNEQIDNLQLQDACTPYQDEMINNLINGMDYIKLNTVRKKIILNYPGTILIDIYMPVRYFSSPHSRRIHSRIDGTQCGQEMILIPNGKKDSWLSRRCLAETGILNCEEKMNLNKETVIFNVFKIGNDMVACEHAINMLKKELENMKG